jgi:hypothetical protein
MVGRGPDAQSVYHRPIAVADRAAGRDPIRPVKNHVSGAYVLNGLPPVASKYLRPFGQAVIVKAVEQLRVSLRRLALHFALVGFLSRRERLTQLEHNSMAVLVFASVSHF